MSPPSVPDQPASPPDRPDVTDEEIAREAERLLAALTDEDWLDWLIEAITESCLPTTRKDVGMADHDTRQNALCAERRDYLRRLRRAVTSGDDYAVYWLLRSRLHRWARLAAEESLFTQERHDDDSHA